MNNSKSIANPLVISMILGMSGFVGWMAGKFAGNRQQSANAILRLVINDFKREGSVVGSWIDHTPRPFQRFAVHTQAYRGGIQRVEDGKVVNYRFIADAYTGSILDMQRH
ncbi:hypothetical protein [Limosilactobacillus secaliphilus]|uniref:PepSY domain-containing protein n=1 Tax=Limosilactobacillus secaliphilus TaxID=396268 RepID=A0A0R2I6B6_9LACO|nr:hypothetical protein [Limosilactobacillus secaliphilus]KRN59174.1 hypothetical protein IV45_GL000212 [Limosilactobacillus secaliphilus]